MPAGVEPVMTPAAEHDEIFFAVRPQLASPNYVVDLELIAPAAVLAFPAIPLEDFHLQLAVTLGVEPKPTSFSKVATHADRLMSRKNCCWCAARRNARNISRHTRAICPSEYRPVQPGCTFKVLRIPACHLGQLAKSAAKSGAFRHLLGGCRAGPDFEANPFMLSQECDDFEQVLDVRISRQAKHAHQALRRAARDPAQFGESDRGVNEVPQHGLAGFHFAREHGARGLWMIRYLRPVVHFRIAISCRSGMR